MKKSYEVIEFDLHRNNIKLGSNFRYVNIYRNGSIFITSINFISIESGSLKDGDKLEFKTEKFEFILSNNNQEQLKDLLKFAVNNDIVTVKMIRKQIGGYKNEKINGVLF